MGNLCINTLSASGSEEQVYKIEELLQEKYGDNVELLSIFEDLNSSEMELTFDSSNEIPKELLKEITDSIPDTTGLYIRVTGDEPATNYLEQSIFKEGKWDFEDITYINTQINALTTQGLEQIRKHLQENGTILNIENDELWTAFYTGNDGDAYSSSYSDIELDPLGKIFVRLVDGTWLYENELKTTHVMDILTIIKEGHGTYSKNPIKS